MKRDRDQGIPENPLGKGGKKPYVAPKLIRYGEVRALTQAASTGMNEPGGGVRMPSERHLKTDVNFIGTHPDGFGIYLFNYRPETAVRWGAKRLLGVMADEVVGIRPDAVFCVDGQLLVDYDALGIRLRDPVVQ